MEKGLQAYPDPVSNEAMETMPSRPSNFAITSDAMPLRTALSDPDDARPDAVTT